MISSGNLIYGDSLPLNWEPNNMCGGVLMDFWWTIYIAFHFITHIFYFYNHLVVKALKNQNICLFENLRAGHILVVHKL